VVRVKRQMEIKLRVGNVGTALTDMPCFGIMHSEKACCYWHVLCSCISIEVEGSRNFDDETWGR
jgi:hypothetical protein